MNVERWLRSRKDSWTKLDQLLHRVENSGMKSLAREELPELGRLYRAASADLSRARAMKLGNDTLLYLNNLVVRAHNQVYQMEKSRWRILTDFLFSGFPLLVRKHALYSILAMVLTVIPALISYKFCVHDSNFGHLELMPGHPIMSEEMWNSVENHQLWTDPVQGFSAQAASMIASNNIRVTVMAFCAGVTGGFGTLWVILVNGLMLGTVFGVCHHYHLEPNLLAFIAPHGVLELSAIFISAGAGFLMGKALLFPGQYRRLDALRLVAMDAVGLFGGCVPMLLIAGTIEGFVSPRTDIPASAKFLVSLATLLGLILYISLPRKKKSADNQ